LVVATQQQQIAQLTDRMDRVEAALERLAQAQARTEERVGRLEAAVERLAQAQARTEQRVEELAQAQARTEQRVEELAQAQARTEREIHALAAAQRESEKHLADLRGWRLEQDYRVKAYAYFGFLLRRVRVVPLQEIEEELERHLSDREIVDLAPLDLLIKGRPRRQPDVPEVWLAVEVSMVVDKHDVERAQRRAAALRRAGFLTIPTAAGKDVTEEAKDAARHDHVLLVQDGRHLFWEEALQAALAT